MWLAALMLPFEVASIGRLMVGLTIDVCMTAGLELDVVVYIVVVNKGFAVEVLVDVPAGETAAATGTLLEVRGFVAALMVVVLVLVLGVTVTCLVEVEVTRGFDEALSFGALELGLTLGVETKDGWDEEAGGGFEDTGTIVAGVVEGESLGEIADSDAEGPAAAVFEAATTGIGSAKVEVAIASPQTRTAMGLLRRVCMVTGNWLRCSERITPGCCASGEIEKCAI